MRKEIFEEHINQHPQSGAMLTPGGGRARTGGHGEPEGAGYRWASAMEKICAIKTVMNHDYDGHGVQAEAKQFFVGPVSVCVCACVHVSVRVCICVHVCASVSVSVPVSVSVCVCVCACGGGSCVCGEAFVFWCDCVSVSLRIGVHT